MAEVITYADVLYTKRSITPCWIMEEYSRKAIKGYDEYTLPPEHRPKPNPLGVTNRGTQYRLVRNAGHWKETIQEKCYADGKWNYGPQENHRYNLPTWAPPVAPQNPSWALELRNKIQSDKVSFAETIGEWREAVGILGDAGRIVKRAFQHAKSLLRARRSRRALRKWFKRVFGRQPGSRFELMDAVRVDLCIKFGIAPIAQQMWDSVEILDRIRATKRRLQVTVRKKTKSKTRAYYGGFDSWTFERSIRAIAYVTYNADDSSFTAGNLGESLWAGTPLSFMVDWFWNFGSYLSSFNAMNGVASFEGAVCTRTRVSGVFLGNQWGWDFIPVEPGKIAYSGYERERITTLPLPSLPSVGIPDTDIWGRLISATEVFASMRKRS